MKVYVEQSIKGLVTALNDIHHRTYDGGRANRIATANSQRKAARRQVKQLIKKEVEYYENEKSCNSWESCIQIFEHK